MIQINQPWTGVAACAFVLVTASASAGDDASRWDGDARSAVRLIAGSKPERGAPWRAGIEIKLKPGWHTYWRYPGDAGVPPVFDFKASQNVKAVEVLWPAPQRLAVEGGVSIGYEREVLLPLRVVAQDAGKPVTLRLRLDYAICEKMCVPAEGKAELVLAGGTTPHDAALDAAQARVPRKVAPGARPGLAVSAVRREIDAGRPRVVVDVAAAAGPVDLFAEGPTAKWALPLPTPVDGAPAGAQRFVFELDGAPPGARYEGAAVTLTAVTPSAAIEVPIRLD